MSGDDVLVRAASVEDLPHVAALDAEVFGAHAYPAFFFRQARDVFGDLLLVAESPSGELAGYALGAVAAGETTGWILSLGVRAAWRGRGAARRLSVGVLEALVQRGAREVRLTVEPGNGAAVALYERLGFQTVAEEADYFGPGEVRRMMRRDL